MERLPLADMPERTALRQDLQCAQQDPPRTDRVGQAQFGLTSTHPSGVTASPSTCKITAKGANSQRLQSS